MHGGSRFFVGHSRFGIIFNRKRRMSDTLATVKTAESLPSELSASETLNVLAYRHTMELERERLSAVTQYNILALKMQGGTFTDAVSHLYPRDVLDKAVQEAKERKEAEESKNRAMETLMRFRQIAQRMNEE